MAVRQEDLRSGGPATASPQLLLWLKIVAVVIAIGVPLQAFLGSESFFKNDSDYRTAHEMLGNIFFLLAVAQVVLGFMALRSGLIPMRGVVTRAILLLLVVAQLGLGYAGRDNLDPRIWHIPNGVLLMGFAAAIAAMSFSRDPS
jgi:ABC-type glucose/galactose transport system permease subunit